MESQLIETLLVFEFYFRTQTPYHHAACASSGVLLERLSSRKSLVERDSLEAALKPFASYGLLIPVQSALVETLLPASFAVSSSESKQSAQIDTFLHLFSLFACSNFIRVSLEFQ